MENLISINRVSVLGQGVGADSEGNIYFVPGALPGDTVKVKVISKDKKYFECELTEVVTPSTERVEAPCTYFSQCGGCDWQHWSYADQLKGKEGILKNALERAMLMPKEFKKILGAASPLNYRNRIQLRQLGNQIGFFRRKSHDLVDIDQCLVAMPELNQEIKRLKTETEPTTEMTKIELYLGEDDKVHSVKNAAHGAEGFRQINQAQNKVLQNLVVELIKKNSTKNVLELYCGNGNFTFNYLENVEKVIAIDSNPNAIEDTKRIREIRKDVDVVSRAAFFCTQVDKSTSRKLPAEFRTAYDTLIVDPPRGGMMGSLDKFLHPKLESIIYISCSAQSFTQDVQCLKNDFDFCEIQPIDMFPHTRHIEFVALFSRRVSS